MTSRLVVGVDGSAGSAEALKWAIAEARLRGAPVEAVYSWLYDFGLEGMVPPLAPAEVEEDAKALLEHAVGEALGAATDVDVSRTATLGNAASVLIDAGRGAEMLVVGTRGRGGFAALLLGSVSHQVLTHAPCPVCVVPEDASTRSATQRIVVGVDGSAGADAALRWAVDEAGRRGAELEVFHVWWFPMAAYVPGTASSQVDVADMRRQALEVIDAAVARVGAGDVTIKRRVREGSVADVLTKAADDADLLVVGSRGRGGFPGLRLGSTSYSVTSHSPCPVVVIPSLPE